GVIEWRGSQRFHRADGCGFLFEDRRGDAELSFAGIGALAGEHFVENGTERKNVAAAVELFAFDLLGGHVLKGSDDGACLRYWRGLHRGGGEGGTGREQNGGGGKGRGGGSG